MTWHEADVGANGIRIHYARTGRDKPPVILAHGVGDDGLCFTRVAKELEGTYDVIMPDARGHGRTTGGVGDYSTDARVADMVGFIEALDLTRPALGGHSMGADTGLHLAASRPDLVSRLVLEDPPFVLADEPMFGDASASEWATRPSSCSTRCGCARPAPRRADTDRPEDHAGMSRRRDHPVGELEEACPTGVPEECEHDARRRPFRIGRDRQGHRADAAVPR